MKKYTHLSEAERKLICRFKKQGYSLRSIAKMIGRSPSTLSRELRRNLYANSRYAVYHAQKMYNARKKRARRGSHFSSIEWKKVMKLINQQYSPQQVSGRLKRDQILSISHETIYKFIWRDKEKGGYLHKQLRGSSKIRRKRYRSKDNRGRLAGKRLIDLRPKSIESRLELGHWEIDTVHGSGKKSIVTIVERASGYVLIGQLDTKKVKDLNKRTSFLINKHPELFRSITADNGCEFHGYKELEKKHQIDFYFTHPYHSWERGSNENTNGLIRQYLPKGCSMENLTQKQCNKIANRLNNRPRKRYGYMTPTEKLMSLQSVALNA